MARPPAKIELVATQDGKKEKKGFGIIWQATRKDRVTPIKGVFNVKLAMPHPTETNDAGYPVDDDIVAVKTRSGAKYLIDAKQGFFLNLNVYEAMDARDPYDPDKVPGRNASGSDEDFGDEDF